MSEAVNREYKDRLFSFIFGREENKKWTLSLYNAINKTYYTNEDDIVINTMSDTIYMGMKNDVSFLISDVLNLYEQQSTYNPNMPVRTYAEKENKYIKISTYLRKWWNNILWLEGTDPEYLSQIMDYTEDAEHDDAPDSGAVICRCLDRKTIGNYESLFR